MKKRDTFSHFFRTVISVVEKTKIDNLLIGGVAVGVWGKPRVTEDVDLILFISKNDVKLLRKVAKSLRLNFVAVKHSAFQKIFTYRIDGGIFHADLLIASTEFEQSALQRKVKVRIFNKNVFVPSKEDLLLFKLIPGRAIDLFDIENIAQRHKGKLDRRYLLKWAERLSDEAQDFRIYKTIKEVLNG